MKDYGSIRVIWFPVAAVAPFYRTMGSFSKFKRDQWRIIKSTLDNPELSEWPEEIQVASIRKFIHEYFHLCQLDDLANRKGCLVGYLTYLGRVVTNEIHHNMSTGDFNRHLLPTYSYDLEYVRCKLKNISNNPNTII